eukprot:gene7933-12402_t
MSNTISIKEIQEELIILDVRSQKEYDNSHLINSILVFNFDEIKNLENCGKQHELKDQLERIIPDRKFTLRGIKYKYCLIYGRFDFLKIVKTALEDEGKFTQIYSFNSLENFFEDNFGLVEIKQKIYNTPTLQVYKGKTWSKTKRQNLKLENTCAFILENFFTDSECRFYIDKLEKIGFRKIDSEYSVEYRNNERLILFSNELSGKMKEKLFPLLTKKDIDQITPIGFGSNGIWKPHKINECFKFCKYEKNQKFEPHRDGIYCPTEDECTIFTVLIYLNDNFTGGNTKFYNSKNELIHVESPSSGNAIVFNSEAIHQAEEVKEGIKYILRTEIVFKRVNSYQIPLEIKENYLTNEKYQKAKKLFNKSESYENTGDVLNYTKTFIEGLELLVENRTSISKQFEDDFLPGDVLTNIFEFMDFNEIINSLLISKHWNYYLVNCNLIWKRNYHKKWPNDNKFIKEDNITDFWYLNFKQRYSIENNFRSLILSMDDQYLNFAMADYIRYKGKKYVEPNYFGIFKQEPNFNVYNKSPEKSESKHKYQYLQSSFGECLGYTCLWFRNRNIDRYEVGEGIFENKYKGVYNPRYFIDDGKIIEMEGFVQALIAIYYDLNIDPNCHPVTIIEPPQQFDSNMKLSIKKTLFEKFNISSICFVNSIDLIMKYYEIQNGTIIFYYPGMESIVCVEKEKVISIQEILMEKQPVNKRRKLNLSTKEIKRALNTVKSLKKPLILTMSETGDSDSLQLQNFLSGLKNDYPDIIFEEKLLMKTAVNFCESPQFASFCNFNSVHSNFEIDLNKYNVNMKKIICNYDWDGGMDETRSLTHNVGDEIYFIEKENGVEDDAFKRGCLDGEYGYFDLCQMLDEYEYDGISE